MIYRCENCVNRHDCSENKSQYTNLCKVVNILINEADKLPDYRCYFSLTLKCDYFVEDTDDKNYQMIGETR